MEALVVVSHHRNQHHYHGKKCGTRFSSFGAGTFSCGRAFKSGSGLLPTPVTLTPSSCSSKYQNFSKTSSIPIPIRFDFDQEKGNGFHVSESWAGPAYSNSPPPSSLPLPNFSLPPKRTALLNFPILPPEIDTNPVAKSTPTSQTCSHDDLFGGADSATRTLCRILNLDVTDE